MQPFEFFKMRKISNILNFNIQASYLNLHTENFFYKQINFTSIDVFNVFKDRVHLTS